MGVPIDPIRREAVKSQATLERGAPRSGGGKTDVFPALPIQGTYEANCQNVPGPNVSIHKMRAPRKSLPEVRGGGA